MKVAWVVTGAGHFLKECLEIVEKNKDKINLFLSSAGIEVIKMYKYGDFLERRDINIVKDYKSSSPSCGAFAARRYDLLVQHSKRLQVELAILWSICCRKIRSFGHSACDFEYSG